MSDVKNVFFSPGHFEGTWERTGGKGIKINGEKIFEEFDFNVGVVNEAHKQLKKYPQLKIHQLEFDNNKEDMTLLERINFINATSKNDDDIVISVHANYSNNTDVGGQWGFKFGDNGQRFLDIYAKHCQNSMIPYTKSFKCKFNTWTEFGIVLRTKPTAVLLEHGFFSNKRERAILRTKTYQNYCAMAIVKTVLEYYGINKNDPKPKEPIDDDNKIELMKKAIKESTDYPDKWIEGFVEAIEIANRQSNLGTFEVFKYLPDFVLKMKGWI